VTKSNTFEEARRIGGIIADAIGGKIYEGIEFSSDVPVSSLQEFVDLPRRQFPDPELAKKHRDESLARFELLKKTSVNIKETRSAEVDWFGSEELLYLSKLALSKDFENIYKTCLPAEIQIIKIGPWNFAAWPGEIYIEYALELKKESKNIFLITLSNGEFQGYIATEEAEKKGYYEASNSVFHYSAGKVLVEKTIELLKSSE
jgi:neutral ceramidase